MSLTENVMGLGLRALHRVAATSLLDRLKLRGASERAVYHAARTGFTAVGSASRAFIATRTLLKPERLVARSGADLFDLTPTEEQAQLQEAARRFAAEQLRPAASAADQASAAEPSLLRASAELGFAVLGIPEALGGAGAERSAMSNVLIAAALAEGDLSLAVACLAPSAVATALVRWGNAEQQARYLTAFTGDAPPAAALAVQEPQALFDPFALKTTARRVGEGYVLEGLKSLVPRAAECELYVVAADCEGEPALFVVESNQPGVTVAAEPAMGLRAAAMGRVRFDNVKLTADARLGSAADYAECIALSRIGWAALAAGTGHAMLDHVIPYANERMAFGEPISHRQAVAFLIADIAIELDGLRLATWRAAARADEGESFVREAAIARQLAADKAMKIGNDGLQVLGGHGFTKEYPVERWYRDLRACGFVEGAVLV